MKGPSSNLGLCRISITSRGATLSRRACLVRCTLSIMMSSIYVWIGLTFVVSFLCHQHFWQVADAFTPLLPHHHHHHHSGTIPPSHRRSNRFFFHVYPSPLANTGTVISNSRSKRTIMSGVTDMIQHHVPDHVPGQKLVNTVFAGRIWPTLKKLHLTPSALRTIGHEILAHTDWQDIVVLFIVAFGTLPIARLFNRRQQQTTTAAATTSTASSVPPDDESEQQDDQFNDSKKQEKTPTKNIVHSFLAFWRDEIGFDPSRLISEMARIALSVYAVEIVCVVLRAMDFHFPALWNIPAVFSKCIYSIYLLRQFIRLKRSVLCKIYHVPYTKMGRIELLDRVITGMSVFFVSLGLVDWLKVRMGVAMKGFVGITSVASLAFTLASKDLVQQFISGLLLSASDNVYTGDKVKFGDGKIKGKIIKLGWLETVVQESDNTITVVPNTNISNVRLSNLSRVKISQVTQTLRFHYDDADKIPSLLDSIKLEIRASCPKLITDGTRSFHAFFTDFKEDHLEVMIDAHFEIVPNGDEYWTNRQNMLLAINRAVNQNGIKFASKPPEFRIIE